MIDIGDLTTRNAWRSPGRDAIIDVPNGRRLTFAQLEERANRLAHGLREELGIAPGERVAILSTNAAEIAETFFACAKAGLVAMPLNWRLAVPEQARILADGEPAALIYNRDVRRRRGRAAAPQRHRALDRVRPGLGLRPTRSCSPGAPAEVPSWSTETGGNDPFFILFTGGTTGTSKGALHSHAGCFAAMVNQAVAERIADDDVYMLLGQMFHIPVVLAMTYLAHGRPVVLMNFEPRETLQAIEAERVSAFLGITTMLNYMMAVDDFDSHDLSSLRLIKYGGGPMAESVVREIMERFPCDLMQGYGQTEGCTMSTLPPWVHREIRAGIGTHRAASCGLEVHLSSVRVVDGAGVPVARDRSALGRDRRQEPGQHGRLLAPARPHGRGLPRRRRLDANR